MYDPSNMIRYNLMHNLVGSLRTDNPILDGLISVLLTGLISWIFLNISDISYFFRKITSHFWCFRRGYVRNIKAYADYDAAHGEWDEDTVLTDCANLPLINAVFYWLHRNNLKLDNNDVQLMISDSNLEKHTENDYERYCNRNVVSIPEEGIRCRISDKLGIDYTTNNIRNKKSRSKEISLSLYSSDKSYIDEFIQECWKIYVEECHRKKDEKKYFYTIDNFTSRHMINCTQYDLCNAKQLHEVFIPEINEIRDLIDHFKQHTGPFSTSFMPYKLGWIFHGLPGCGKTSLIKAMANYTGRHIINVSFANIQTNAELFKLFYSPTIVVDRQNLKYKISDVIYVIDDIDAVGDTIRERIMMEKTQEKDDSSSDSDSDTSNKYQVRGRKIKPKIKTKKKQSDSLNLQGILSVFDGTLDSPGRMVIITTNHIDRIDQALKRPGRVNQIIEFKKMTRSCTKEYIEACFGISLTAEQVARIPDMKLTPAKIEEYAIEEYGNADALIDKINDEASDLQLVELED